MKEYYIFIYIKFSVYILNTVGLSLKETYGIAIPLSSSSCVTLYITNNSSHLTIRHFISRSLFFHIHIIKYKKIFLAVMH